jgi:hypothetical protein
MFKLIYSPSYRALGQGIMERARGWKKPEHILWRDDGDGEGKSGEGGRVRGNVCVARNSSTTSKSICLAAA